MSIDFLCMNKVKLEKLFPHLADLNFHPSFSRSTSRNPPLGGNLDEKNRSRTKTILELDIGRFVGAESCHTAGNRLGRGEHARPLRRGPHPGGGGADPNAFGARPRALDARPCGFRRGACGDDGGADGNADAHPGARANSAGLKMFMPVPPNTSLPIIQFQ